MQKTSRTRLCLRYDLSVCWLDKSLLASYYIDGEWLLVRLLTSKGVLFSICFVSVILFGNCHDTGRTLPQNHLPDFRAIDIHGRRIDKQMISGRSCYIQLVRSRSVSEVELFRKVYEEWLNDNIEIIGITDDPDILLSKLGADPASARIISDNGGALGRLFNAGSADGSYYIFTPDGVSIDSGLSSRDYEDAVKPTLMRLLRNEFFEIRELIGTATNINDVPAFGSLARRLKENKRPFCVFSFFSMFCSTCATASLINELKRINEVYQDNIAVFSVLLSDQYSEAEIPALRSQASVDFSFVISDPPLTSVWLALINKYNRSSLNGIAMLIDKEGNIRSLYSPGCGCIGEFRRSLEGTRF
jgi:hypothetical protein